MEVLNSLIMKITANENDTNDILQTFQLLLLSPLVHCKLNCSDHAASLIGHWGKHCEKWKTRRAALMMIVTRQFIKRQFIEQQFIERQFIERQFIEWQFIETTVHRTDSSSNRQFIGPTVYWTDSLSDRQFIEPTVHRTDSLSDRQFIEPTVCRTDSLSNRQFNEPTVCRTDSLSNRQFNEPTVYRIDSSSNNSSSNDSLSNNSLSEDSLSKQDKLTSKMYAKTVNLLCAGKNVFAKYQAWGAGFNPNPPLAYTLVCHWHTQNHSKPLQLAFLILKKDKNGLCTWTNLSRELWLQLYITAWWPRRNNVLQQLNQISRFDEQSIDKLLFDKLSFR